MFEVGWTEMLVIAVVMIVVVGPKDLPAMLRTFGRMTAKARGMANDFRRQFDEAIKEAELDDVKKSVESLRSLNPATEIRKQLNPFEKAAADVRAGLDEAMKPKPASPPVVEAADAPAQPAEPLKNGATAMPGVAGPDAMPAAPVFAAGTEAATTAATPARTTKATKVAAAANGKAKAVAATSSKPAATKRLKPATKTVAAKSATGKSAAKAKPVAKTGGASGKRGRT